MCKNAEASAIREESAALFDSTRVRRERERERERGGEGEVATWRSFREHREVIRPTLGEQGEKIPG